MRILGQLRFQLYTHTNFKVQIWTKVYIYIVHGLYVF